MRAFPLFRRYALSGALIALLSVLLTACKHDASVCVLSFLPCNPPTVDAAIRKPCQPQSTYLRKLALARLNPGETPRDLALPLCSLLPQSVVVIEYKPEHQNAIREVAAGFDLKEDSPDFDDLEQVMTQLGEQPSVLQDVKLYMVRVKPGMLKADTPPAREAAWARMFKHANRLPSLEEARVGLALLRFFMEHRYRDAAYLTLENTKLALANASKDLPNEREYIADRSRELEQLEARLKQELPYRL